jgi:hypothetical protein
MPTTIGGIFNADIAGVGFSPTRISDEIVNFQAERNPATTPRRGQRTLIVVAEYYIR